MVTGLYDFEAFTMVRTYIKSYVPDNDDNENHEQSQSGSELDLQWA